MASDEVSLKKYFGFVACSFAAIFALYFIEERFMGDLQGLLMGVVEVGLELAMLRTILKIRRLSEKKAPFTFLALFFLFLGLGDFFYVLLYYGLHVSSRTVLSSTLTTLMYNVGYFAGAVALIVNTGLPKSWLKQKSNYVVYLLCLPLALRLLLIPFLNSPIPPSNFYFSTLEVLAVTGTLLLLAHAIITLIAARSLLWTNAATGIVVLVISDWALRVEKLIDDAPKFGFYEGLYCFGIATLSYSFVKAKSIPKIELIASNSLISKTRAASLVAIFLSVLFLSLSQYGTRDSIRFASVGCIFGAFLSTFLSFYLIREIENVNRLTRNIASEAVSETDEAISQLDLPAELKSLFDESYFHQTKTRKEQAVLQRKVETQKELLGFAAQVAHDIRSPLAALEMMAQDFGELPAEKQTIVMNAVGRIRDIANSLISKNRGTINFTNIDKESTKSQTPILASMISPILESVITEKRLQYRALLHVHIDFDRQSDIYGFFGMVQPAELQRIISNLIDNAVEALNENQGKIIVSLKRTDADIEIAVSDNGRGMSPDALSRVGQRGFTHGKPSGSGLGLFHAFETVHTWGGSIEIKSTLNVGTTVKMLIQEIPQPKWFARSLELSPETGVVILDDEPSIHELWKGKFAGAAFPLPIHHLSNSNTARRFYGDNFDRIENLVFLVDFKLNGSDGDGLSIIEELGIQSQSYLVTSHYDDHSVQDRCSKLGCKIIPKSLINHLRLEFIESHLQSGLKIITERKQNIKVEESALQV